MIHTIKFHNKNPRDSTNYVTDRLHNSEINGGDVMENRKLEDLTMEVLSKADKKNFKSPGYKQGFEDCLKLLVEIFGLNE